VRQNANLQKQVPEETPKLAPLHEPDVNVGQIHVEKSADDVKIPPPLAANGIAKVGSSQPAAKKSVLCSFVNATMSVRVALIMIFCMLVGLGGNGTLTPVENHHSMWTSFGQTAFISYNASTKQSCVNECASHYLHQPPPMAHHATLACSSQRVACLWPSEQAHEEGSPRLHGPFLRSRVQLVRQLARRHREWRLRLRTAALPA
jgi:hypothetical protein